MVNKTNYVMAIDIFWRNFSQDYQNWAEANGLSSYEYIFLYWLGRHKSVTQKEITSTYIIPKQSASYAAKSLYEKGLIEFVASKTDRREKVMILTDAGAELVKKCIVPLLKIEEKVFEEIGAERIEKMLETAELFSGLISKEMDKKITKGGNKQ